MGELEISNLDSFDVVNDGSEQARFGPIDTQLDRLFDQMVLPLVCATKVFKNGSFKVRSSIVRLVPSQQFSSSYIYGPRLGVPIITGSQFGHTKIKGLKSDTLVLILSRSRLSGLVSQNVGRGLLKTDGTFERMDPYRFEKAALEYRQKARPFSTTWRSP